ncbi:MAG: hypothetical protein P4L79_00030 [Legionella sp.]|uniref:hypothetical protein n=1 Tax=Legionella sp. TaxID=459 RepID=UPI00284DAD5A|nr:hypothetical protein [Legionella sp.]
MINKELIENSLVESLTKIKTASQNAVQKAATEFVDSRSYTLFTLSRIPSNSCTFEWYKSVKNNILEWDTTHLAINSINDLLNSVEAPDVFKTYLLEELTQIPNSPWQNLTFDSLQHQN